MPTLKPRDSVSSVINSYLFSPTYSELSLSLYKTVRSCMRCSSLELIWSRKPARYTITSSSSGSLKMNQWVTEKSPEHCTSPSTPLRIKNGHTWCAKQFSQSPPKIFLFDDTQIWDRSWRNLMLSLGGRPSHQCAIWKLWWLFYTDKPPVVY